MTDIAKVQENQALERRAAIQHLEDVMMEMEEKVDLPVIHHFADHAYARELHIPADTALVGKIHRTRHLNILAKGTIVIVTENGKETMTAPRVLIAEPGTKRVGYTVTDTVWITVHGGVDETDLDKLEAQLIAPSYEALEQDQQAKLDSEEHF